MTAKLTTRQAEALQKIADNHGKISNLGASHINAKGRMTVHHTVAMNLYVRGYIEAYNPETGRSFHAEDDGLDVSPWYSGRYFWRLTSAGREALGVFDNLSPTAKAVAEASILRDEAMMVAYKAEGTPWEAEADAAYNAACAARWDAVNAHREAREANGDFGPRAQREQTEESGIDWTNPNEKFYAFGNSPEKEFHRKVKDAIGLKW